MGTIIGVSVQLVYQYASWAYPYTHAYGYADRMPVRGTYPYACGVWIHASVSVHRMVYWYGGVPIHAGTYPYARSVPVRRAACRYAGGRAERVCVVCEKLQLL